MLYMRLRCYDVVLEIGGGMAALAGLGLSTCEGLCKEIVVTDGHPDCVKNQVKRNMLGSYLLK